MSIEKVEDHMLGTCKKVRYPKTYILYLDWYAIWSPRVCYSFCAKLPVPLCCLRFLVMSYCLLSAEI